jgi:hypothetical protein
MTDLAALQFSGKLALLVSIFKEEVLKQIVYYPSIHEPKNIQKP